MDGWMEAIAFLILIMATGAGELFKKVRKSTQKKSSPTSTKPISDPPSEWYEETEPVDEKKEEDTMTKVFKELFDVQEPEIIDEPPPPPAAKGNTTDRPKKGNVFEEWDFPIDHEKPVFKPELPLEPEPAATYSKPKIGPALKTDVPPPKVKKKRLNSIDLLAGASAHSSQSTFQNLYDRYGDNPLKLAVVYNEILNRPRAMHNKPMRRYT